MNKYNTTLYFKNFKIYLNGKFDKHLYYSWGYGYERRAIEHYVCPFGGNPYSGTIIEYYILILPNGKKYKYNIRA